MSQEWVGLGLVHLRNTKWSIVYSKTQRKHNQLFYPKVPSFLLDKRCKTHLLPLTCWRSKTHQPLTPFLVPTSPLPLLIHKFSSSHYKLKLSLLSKPHSNSSTLPNLFYSSSHFLIIFYPISFHHPHKPFKNHLLWSLEKQRKHLLATFFQALRKEAIFNHFHSSSFQEIFVVVTLTPLSSMFSSSRTPKLSIVRWF